MLQYVMMSYVSKLRVYGNEIELRNRSVYLYLTCSTHGGLEMLGDSLYLENIQEYVHDEEKIVSELFCANVT